MYTLLFVLGAAACAYLLVGSIVFFRRQQAKASTLDKEASLSTVKHPVMSNPIFILYVVTPVLTIVIAMILVFLTQQQ